VNEFTSPVRIVAPFEESVDGIELDRERSQGVRENVVDSRPIRCARSTRGTVPFGVGSHPLDEQFLGLHRSLDVLVPAGTGHHGDDHEEGSLGYQYPGTADHQSGHSLRRDTDDTEGDGREAAEGDRRTMRRRP